MVKIIWEGNQDWDKEYPEGRPPENARKLQRPADVLKASVPYGIIPMLICFSCVFYKKARPPASFSIRGSCPSALSWAFCAFLCTSCSTPYAIRHKPRSIWECA